MGYGKSGSPKLPRVLDGIGGLPARLPCDPGTSVTSARKPMDSALAAAVRHINSVLHTHLRA